VLWEPQAARKVPSYVFDVPSLVPLFESEGEGRARKTLSRRKALVLPRKGGHRMEFVAFPTEPGMDLAQAQAMVSAGTGRREVAFIVPVTDWTEGRAPARRARGCPARGQCFRFDDEVTDAMAARVRARKDLYTAQFALLAGSASWIDTISDLKRVARLEGRSLFRPRLREMFPQADSE